MARGVSLGGLSKMDFTWKYIIYTIELEQHLIVLYKLGYMLLYTNENKDNLAGGLNWGQSWPACNSVSVKDEGASFNDNCLSFSVSLVETTKLTF